MGVLDQLESEIMPRSPWSSRLAPAVKYNVFGSPTPSARKTRAQSPGLMITLPSESLSGPRDSPVTGPKALMTPSPKLPIRISLPKAPKLALAWTTPHGALSGPLVTKRRTSAPSSSKVFPSHWPSYLSYSECTGHLHCISFHVARVK